MIYLSKQQIFQLVLAIATSIILAAPASATWSIIGVDRETGEIGIAGASCTFDVSGIASIVPGKGAVVVQAASNYFARMQGVKLMEENATVEDILKAMKQEKFTPSRQQYGVISIQASTLPLVESGAEIKGHKGARIASDFAVFGNILTGQDVLDDAYDSFNSLRNKTLATRLIRALEAGANAGGDKRCDEQHARSAFISIYSPEIDGITHLSVFGTDKGGKPAVALLTKKFDKLYALE